MALNDELKEISDDIQESIDFFICQGWMSAVFVLGLFITSYAVYVDNFVYCFIGLMVLFVSAVLILVNKKRGP